MKQVRWLALAMALCFSVAAFTTPADAAPAAKDAKAGQKRTVLSKKKPSSSKKIQTSASHKTSSIKKAARSSSKKQRVNAGKGKKSSKVASRRVSSKKHSRSSTKSRRADPRIWLDRSGDSELLSGQASWYGKDFHGGKTASGAPYDMYTYTAAHRTLPLGTVVKVTDKKTGRSVMVCINNRGPFAKGRIIDLSYAAAEELGLRRRGVAPVNLEVVSNAEGKTLKEDEAFYVIFREENTEKASVGPFRQYADASVMHEVMRSRHPNATIVLGPSTPNRD